MSIIRIGTTSCLCTSTSSKKQTKRISNYCFYNVSKGTMIQSSRKRDFSESSQNCNKNTAEQRGFSMMNFLMVASLLMIWPQIEKNILGRMGRLHEILGDGKRSA